MKKFRYRLEQVLDYKNQTLNDLKTQQAEIAGQVKKKTEEICGLKDELGRYGNCLDAMKQQGAKIQEIRLYDACLDWTQRRIEEENKRLLRLKKREEEKKQEVIKAKIDTSRYEKLKEKKYREYQRAVLKAQEAQIEEFVSGSAIRRTRKESGRA